MSHKPETKVYHIFKNHTKSRPRGLGVIFLHQFRDWKDFLYEYVCMNTVRNAISTKFGSQVDNPSKNTEDGLIYCSHSAKNHLYIKFG